MKKQSKKGWIAVVAILLVAALAVNIACASLETMITSWMGVNLNPMLTGSKAESSAEILSVAEATEQSLRISEELEGEGVVLLKNDNAALPLGNGAKVNLFGFASIDPIYGGTGSGAGDTSQNVDVVAGLTNAGLSVNPELVKFYQTSGVSRVKQNGFSGSNFTPAEVPASAYTDAVLSQAKDYSDTAIIVLSRIGGEGGDLPMDMFAAGYSQTDDGRHYLELTQDEEDLLALVKAQGFAKTIVMVNSSHAMELGFVDGVDAAIWVGGPGAVGFNAVGKVLSGEVNPSGRLVDTYAYDMTTAPAYWNAGDFTYGNIHRNYVEYAEGIYVGYRYYETAAADGYIDYAKTVQYPFGYGLSYTTFEQTIESYADGGSSIAMQVKVTNTGSVAGKDVVQVYYTAPYTKGGIEKAHVVLAGFAKTKLLQPGESETVMIAFAEEDMASFDAFGAGCYVLEAGDYEIKLMNNAHDVIDSRMHTVKETVTYGEGNPRSTDKTAAVAHFADVQNGQITVYVSRSDWEGTTPKERVDGKTASDAVVKAFSEKAPYEVNDSDPAIVYADNGLVLEDMAGLDWDDPKWELLLQQLSDEDMATMILNGGWSTPAVASVGKPATSDLDGPAGINSLVSSLKGVQFPTEAVIGSTWNAELVEEFGKVFAQEAAANGVVGLYAPGMNIHRTPFGGRNFEYYSEDGLLSGKLGAAQVRGSESQGVYMYAKHFALNDQESNRLSISVWANEQAMRELYFKPFELTVKEGKTTAIMSSYSYFGTTWAGGSKALITDVLRNEWGFVGMVVTDSAMSNTSWMDPNLAVRAGNDMMLCLMGASIDSSNNTARNAMRAACHNILYTQANSAAVQVEADNTPYWYALVALFNAIVLSVILLLVLKHTAFKNKKMGVVGVVTVLAVFVLCGLLVWFAFIKPTTVKKQGGGSAEAVETSETAEEPKEEKPEEPKEEAKPAEAPAAAATVAPETGMELYELASGWLGCHVNINADGTYTIAYDYSEEYKGIESDKGTWVRVSDSELTLTSDQTGATVPVTLADGKWSCELTESNTSTVCHPFAEVGAAPAAAAAVSPEDGMELYELAAGWLGCHVNINADGTYTIAYDYSEEYKGIESDKGTWVRVSDTELTLTSDQDGKTTPVTLADGKWSCEVTESNTSTVCHPFVEAGAAPALAVPAVSPEDGMELYELAAGWLGCHVNINADGTYTIAYDYSEEYKGIESDKGTWVRVSDTELTLTSDQTGATVPVTLADGKWSCELTEANTSTVCHPFIESGEPSAAATAAEPEAVTYTVVYMGVDDAVYATLNTTDGTAVPEISEYSCELVEPNTQTKVRPTAILQKGYDVKQGLELSTRADGWLGCHVTVNADGTYAIAYDYNEENKGVVSDQGTWENVPNIGIVLTNDKGEQSAIIEWLDAVPMRDGYRFAGWQSKPNVTKDELVLGVSPYEVPLGASSLYGGEGTAITQYELMNGNMLILYPRWAERTEIHSAEELKTMKDDLMGWYVLANDIDLAGENWQPVGMYFSNYETVNAPYWTYAFRGMLDGDGHAIQNLAITVDSCKGRTEGFENAKVWRNDGEALGADIALFGASATAKINNVTFEAPVLNVTSQNDATPYVGVLCG
ncbi:MAG: glycoside hydrolase family 3 N-terminal domain-containing protein, partial [Clostridia bacterium]|nr:glycoside hydrolase family 3 N-terminal domain-containing protein [Clostridia bacterium]